MADHRLPLRASQVEDLARDLARTIGIGREPFVEIFSPHIYKWIAAVAKDLHRYRGSSIVVAGYQQPPVVHALVHAINHALDNVGKTVLYVEPVEANPVSHIESLRQLVNDIDRGRVEVLLIIGGNPVFTAPVDFQFAQSLTKVRLRVHLSLYPDETSELCHWHIPETHYLESWSDIRAFDGTISIMQPLIAPLYEGKSAHELFAAVLQKVASSSYDVRLFDAHLIVAHQFEDMEQQREASSLGMWAFLITEIMFFGGLFTGYAVYRSHYSDVFAHASRHLDLALGAVNTIVLIASSLTMALAVHAVQLGIRRLVTIFLLVTILLGSVFLVIKAVEYSHKFEEKLIPGRQFTYEQPDARHAQLFFSFYFAMTGMHALHMVVGIGILSALVFLNWRGRFSRRYYAPVELSGLYWHFVDIVWIFLFPLFYLISRH